MNKRWYITEGPAGQSESCKEEVGKKKKKRVLLRYVSVILGYNNQGDEITAHPHSEHGVQIHSLNFQKDAAKLDWVQNKARSDESFAAQEAWKNGAC